MSLRVKKVEKRRPGSKEPILKDVSFELSAGRHVALLGRSGAGKSTLLRCVIGLEPFERGEVEVDGVTVRGTEQSSTRQRAAALAAMRERMASSSRRSSVPAPDCAAELRAGTDEGETPAARRSREAGAGAARPARPRRAGRSRGRWRWSPGCCCTVIESGPPSKVLVAPAHESTKKLLASW